MKRYYNKHQYSGCLKSKRSRVAFKRQHGIESRSEVWRKPESSLDVPEHYIDEPSCSAADKDTCMPSLDQPTAVFSYPPKADYSRKSRMTLEAPVLCLLSQQREEPRILENVNHAFKVENVTYDPLHGLDGYRMVDIHHVLNWVMKMSLNHAKMCPLGQVEFRKDERKGLFRTFTFGCTVCNKKLVQTLEPLENPKVNKACVWG